MKKRNWMDTGSLLAALVIIGLQWCCISVLPSNVHCRLFRYNPHRTCSARSIPRQPCYGLHGLPFNTDWNDFPARQLQDYWKRRGNFSIRNWDSPGLFPPNITPFNLGNWTDCRDIQAITSGESRTAGFVPNHPIFLRDSWQWRYYSIIAYIRSLPVIRSTPPESNPAFPITWSCGPSPKRPAFSKTLSWRQHKYGEYLVRLHLHWNAITTAEHGQIVKSQAFAGGREFIMPNGCWTSPNITPDPENRYRQMSREISSTVSKDFDPLVYNAVNWAGVKWRPSCPGQCMQGWDAKDLGAIMHIFTHCLLKQCRC